MLDASVLNICLDYYERKTGYTVHASQKEIIENMLRRGMNGGRVMDCIDAAAVHCGLTAYGQDYWNAFYKAAREEYNTMKAQGIIPKRRKQNESNRDGTKA